MQDKTLPWPRDFRGIRVTAVLCKFRPRGSGARDDGSETGRDYRVAGDDAEDREGRSEREREPESERERERTRG